MHSRRRSLIFLTLPLASLTIFCLSSRGLGQIIPDRSLGAESSTLAPDTINGMPSDRIDGGAARGANLFHSFREFNVQPGSAAYFSNPAGILNILTRVTGTNASTINGTLGVLGNANLFLINPNGIVFGANARLDLRGSFLASSAESLLFDNGFEFSANSPEAPPLLTVNIPIGLRLRDNPAPLQLQGADLALTSGNTLSLIGGSVNIDGSSLKAPAGRVELASLTTPGTVGINFLSSGSQPGLNLPADSNRGDINLINGSRIDVMGGGGGDIAIHSGNLLISNSSLNAGIAENSGGAGAAGGNIDINATGNTALTQQSLISNVLQSNSIGNGGNIEIDTGNLSIEGGSRIENVTAAEGAAGNILINADLDIKISGFTSEGLFSGILSRSPTPSSGAGGNVTVTSAGGNLNLSNRGFIAAVTNSNSPGGKIDVNVNNLVLESGGQILSATTSGGNAGNITINAAESVRLSGESKDFVANPFLDIPAFNLDLLQFLTEPNPNVEESGVGGIPYVSIQRTPEQIVSGTTVLGAATQSFDYYQFSITQGNSRAIFDIDDGRKSGDRTSLDTQIFLFNLATGELLATNDDSALTRGSQGSNFRQDSYITTTFNSPGVYLLGVSEYETSAASGNPLEGNRINVGKAYTLNISLQNQGTEGVPLPKNNINPDNFNPNRGNRSGILSASEGTGAAGKLAINTRQLILTNGAEISTNALGAGAAGEIIVKAVEAVNVNNSRLSSMTRGEGSTGNLTIDTRRLTLANGGRVETITFASGDGGNVNVNATSSVEVLGLNSAGSKSGIRSEAQAESSGNAGHVAIATNRLSVRDGGRIETDTSGSGNAGSVEVRAEESVEIVGINSSANAVSAISSNTDDSTGNAGNVSISTQRLSVRDGAQVQTITFAAGNGGALTVLADTVELVSGSQNSRSGLFSSAIDRAGDGSGTGAGGTVSVSSDRLIVRDGAIISASNFHSRNAYPPGKGPAGNIQIEARQVQLDNQGSITAAAAVGNRGNIMISASDIVMRDGSTINTNATGTATGGNIEINTENLAALRNSDTSANAQQSFGGRVNINALGIFGTGFRDRNTPISDITASSELGASFSGTVELKTPDVDPSSGLVTLPQTVVDVTSLVGQNPCSRGSESKFTIIGKGGLPPNPAEPLTSSAALVDWATTEDRSQLADNNRMQETLIPKSPNPIVPARGWIFNEKGEVVLTNYDPTGTGENRPWKSPFTCSKTSVNY